MGDTAMMNYPPVSGGPNAPPIGFNPPSNPNYPVPGYPHMDAYPPASGDSQYPPPGGYMPSDQSGYPPPAAGGYPPGGPPMYPQPGYPPPSGYPPPVNSYVPPGGPMTVQPTATSGYPASGDQGNWMPRPVDPLCPPGLEYLTMVDQLLVHQKVELLEAFTSFETKNKYTIKNSMGQKIYTAKEDTDCCTRNCLGTMRPFDLKIKDMSGQEVIHLYRPLRCDSCIFPCCLQKIEVEAPPGTVIGSVIQEWSICIPKFRIENAAGECVLLIEGPLCTFSICGDVEFKVLSRDGSMEVGKITKQWSGLLREAFTDADHFGISFPMDLDVHIKAVLLGAVYLIDFMFFEKQGNKEQDMPGML